MYDLCAILIDYDVVLLPLDSVDITYTYAGIIYELLPTYDEITWKLGGYYVQLARTLCSSYVGIM